MRMGLNLMQAGNEFKQTEIFVIHVACGARDP